MVTKDLKEQDKESRAKIPILIMGVGNILMSDDGVGIHTIRVLQKLPVPENVELLDAGTASMSFLDSLSNREKVIIIDAVKANGEPGTIYRFTPDDIRIRKDASTSLHQIGIMESLTMFEFIGNRPQEVIIFGVEPDILEWGMDLSPKVEAVIPRLVEMICTELEIKGNNNGYETKRFS